MLTRIRNRWRHLGKLIGGHCCSFQPVDRFIFRYELSFVTASRCLLMCFRIAMTTIDPHFCVSALRLCIVRGRLRIHHCNGVIFIRSTAAIPQWNRSINSSDSTVESLDQQQRFPSGIARSTAAIPQWNRSINSSVSTVESLDQQQ